MYSYNFNDELIDPLDLSYLEQFQEILSLFGENNNNFNNLNFIYEQSSTLLETLNQEVPKVQQNLSSSIHSSKEKKIYQNSNNSTTNPKFFSMKEIENLLKLINNQELQDKLKLVNIENREYKIENSNEYYFMKYLKRKRIRNEESEYSFTDDTNLKEENGKKTKKGRTKETENDREEHTKFKSDNIIKKIKAKLFEYCIDFLNKICLKYDEKHEKLLKLDYYKYINNLNRNTDLAYLNMPLWELFSENISRRYTCDENTIKFKNDQRKKKINHNKIILDKIKGENQDNTLNFALDMTFSDFIDLFTGKKNVKNLVEEKNIGVCSIDYDTIQNCIEGVEKILNLKDLKINDKEDKKYFIRFLFYLFNYERWFSVKTPRTFKKKNLKEIIV